MSNKELIGIYSSPEVVHSMWYLDNRAIFQAQKLQILRCKVSAITRSGIYTVPSKGSLYARL